MSRPNIVFIICHDLGRQLQCYGIDTVHSPNIDRLAAEGVRFDNHFCTAPQCSPSRAALATGRFPHQNGVMGLSHAPMNWALHEDERTIGKVLRDGGYFTALAGLQHIHQGPERLGFMEHFDKRITPAGKDCNSVVAAVEAGLDDLEGKRPFYLEIGFVEPHLPFESHGTQPDDSLGVSVPPYVPESDAARADMAAMQGAIRKVDGAVGCVLELLHKRGLDRNTIVIFTTDHGIPFPRAKGTLYDSGLGTAFIVRWPEHGAGGGRTINAQTSHIDVMPTLLDAAVLPSPEGIAGESFLNLLLGRTQQGRARQGREAIFGEKTYHNTYDPMRAIRTEHWKFIRNFEANVGVEIPTDICRTATYRTMMNKIAGTKHPPTELYDLHADPLEQNNLAGVAEYEQTRRELSWQLSRWMKLTGDPLLHGPIPSPFFRASHAECLADLAGG